MAQDDVKRLTSPTRDDIPESDEHVDAPASSSSPPPPSTLNAIPSKTKADKNTTITNKENTPLLPASRGDDGSARRTRKVYAVFGAIVLSLVFTVLVRAGGGGGSKWGVEGSRNGKIPDVYAICSRERGGAVYVVEEKERGSDSSTEGLKNDLDKGNDKEDEDEERVQCVVVWKGVIADRGSVEYVRTRWGDKNKVGPPGVGGDRRAPAAGVEIRWLKEGQALYPGFADAHAHLLGYGNAQQLPLLGSESPKEVTRRAREYVLSHPDVLNDTGRWIEGQGWNQNLWPGQQYPHANDLDDPILKDRPIVLYRIDVHALWVSPKVLELLGPLPKSVEGGVIVRDGDGMPTGVFVDAAMALVEAIKPQWSDLQMLSFFRTAVRDAVKYGLTSIHDASTFPFMIDFYKKLADRRLLPIRLYLMAHLDDTEYWGDQIEKFEHPSGRLTLRSVKLFTDGAIGSFGAALLAPYSDNPTTSGTLIQPPEVITELIHRFVNDGWQTNVHCIGDRANRIVLDAFKSSLPSNESLAERRNRLEHAQIIALEDIERVGKLGVIASIQPTHATSDMSYAEQRLGPERIKGAYAWRSLLSTGAWIALGSDFPVEDVNPLKGFYAAVTRLTPEGTSPHGPGGWYPSQRLTRAEALRGMTLDAAYASFSESKLGSITHGKRADLVILSRDIMRVPQEEILGSEVVATIVDGKVVYGAI